METPAKSTPNSVEEVPAAAAAAAAASGRAAPVTPHAPVSTGVPDTADTEQRS